MNWWQHPRAAKVIAVYQTLSQRERQLVTLVLHVLLLFVVALLVLDPLYQSVQQERRLTNSLTGESKQLEQQLETLRSIQMVDPNQQLRDDLEALQVENANIQIRIDNLTDALVSPENMVSVLEQMLTQDKRLKITSLVSIPKQAVELEGTHSNVKLFRHGLKITVNATYSSLVAYLKRLDTLQWRLYWQALEYEVDRYPNGKLTLEVYTLSTREEVLGA